MQKIAILKCYTIFYHVRQYILQCVVLIMCMMCITVVQSNFATTTKKFSFNFDEYSMNLERYLSNLILGSFE